jgi:ribonuclease P protein component
MVLRVISEDPRLLRPELRRHPTRCCRCALVISSKVSKRAVRRNRLRRLLHHHLRQQLEHREDLAGRWVLISLRPEASQADPSQLLEECDSLLNCAGLGQ